VVASHRLAGLKHTEVNAELSKARLAFEVDVARASFGVVPSRVAGVDDEPTIADRDKPFRSLLELSRREHRTM
jgi:hypothetical protein